MRTMGKHWLCWKASMRVIWISYLNSLSLYRLPAPTAFRPAPANISTSYYAGGRSCRAPSGGCHPILLIYLLQSPTVYRAANHDAAHGALPLAGEYGMFLVENRFWLVVCSCVLAYVCSCAQRMFFPPARLCSHAAKQPTYDDIWQPPPGHRLIVHSPVPPSRATDTPDSLW